MSINSPIEWCDSTINPVMGCDGCELSSRGAADAVEDGRRTGHCYAEALHVIRAGRPGYAPDFFSPTQFAGRMAQAARWSDLRGTKRPSKPWLDGMPRMIFISDMGDALSASVPFEFLCVEIIDSVASMAGSRHVWLWLTKRPRRMAEFSQWLKARGIPWPRNLWAGTSVTSQATRGRLDHLCAVADAAMRFVSYEPALGPVDFRLTGTWSSATREFGRWITRYRHPDGEWRQELPPRVGWLICGGESGPGARPCDAAWLQSAVEQARGAGVPVFVKQLGTHLAQELRLPGYGTTDGRKADRVGRELGNMPEALRVRELPRLG